MLFPFPFNIDPEMKLRAEAAYEGAFMSSLQLALPYARKAEPDAVRLHLQQSGAIYLWMRAGMAERPTVHAQWRERKAQIDAVAVAAEQMRQALDGLDNEAAAYFWRDMRHDVMTMMSSHPKTFGDKVAHNAKGKAAPVFLLNEANLTKAVAILEDIARDAVSRFNFPAGKPRNMALQVWIRQMRLLLPDFGQSFTYSDGPDGKSPALQFCEFVMAPLDPEVTPKQVGGAMRQVISDDRKARHRLLGGVLSSGAL